MYDMYVLSLYVYVVCIMYDIIMYIVCIYAVYN